MTIKAEAYTCGRCMKTLWHDKQYCPLFPEVEPPSRRGKPGKKWSRCVCLIHTCYDAAALGFGPRGRIRID